MLHYVEAAGAAVESGGSHGRFRSDHSINSIICRMYSSFTRVYHAVVCEIEILFTTMLNDAQLTLYSYHFLPA